MTDLTVRLSRRNLDKAFYPLVVGPRVNLEVASYSWNVIGGPERANITATGSREALWNAAEWLVCPVEIIDWRNEAVWWGYVDAVSIRAGAVEVGLSVADMANEIWANYSAIAAGAASIGSGAYTGWVAEVDAGLEALSLTEYGRKQLQLSLGECTAAVALEAVTRMLKEQRFPVPTVRLADGNSLSATLTCKGWWATLDWCYAPVLAAYNNVVTTTQIGQSNMVGYSQFIGVVQVDDASGQSISEYKNGETRIKTEVEKLLAYGVSGGRRLLASVQRDRTLRVYQEPLSAMGTDYWLDADGRLYLPNGQRALDHTCPVGAWARLRDVLPGSLDTSRLGQITPLFIERAEYNVAAGRLTPEVRNGPSPWSVGQIDQG